MASRFRPLQALFASSGFVSAFVVAKRSTATPATCDDDEPSKIRAGIAAKLEAWLMPSDGEDSLGAMVKDLIDAVSEDFQISADDRQLLPLNFLMVKAMHDRELLASTGMRKRVTRKVLPAGFLGPRDRQTIRRSAHYARFAAASYDGYMDTIKELAADEDVLPPPDLFYKSNEYIRQWAVAKRLKIEPEDVKELAANDSPETRTYLVAVDHASRSVVVGIRGTYSFTDTMVDLLCNPVDFAGGKAHQGISQSALRVWKDVKPQVEKQLREFSDYKLVLTGHSLGAGTAILLKIMLARNSTEVLKRTASGRGAGAAETISAKLNVGRPVRVECYAFAPPPVFSAPGAAHMQDVFSFVNGADCVPTMSLGSLYSLFRTIQNVGKLQLDVYKRAEFVLDTRVRVQESARGLKEGDGEDGRRNVALAILGLRTHPSLAFLGGTKDETELAEEDVGNIWEDVEEELEEEGGEDKDRRPQAAVNAGETAAEDLLGSGDGISIGGIGLDDSDGGSANYAALGAEAFRSAMSRCGEEWARFTRDVNATAEGLLAAVDAAGSSAGSLFDSVGRVTGKMREMSSEEVALTALLLKQLEEGGGPSPDQVLSLVQKCERDGIRPRNKGACRHSGTMTVGDLIIPGKVYLLEGWNVEDGGQKDDEGKRGGAVSVRKTSSAELGGIRLHANMMDDHSMNAYESAVIAAAKRYTRC